MVRKARKKEKFLVDKCRLCSLNYMQTSPPSIYCFLCQEKVKTGEKKSIL